MRGNDSTWIVEREKHGEQRSTIQIAPCERWAELQVKMCNPEHERDHHRERNTEN